jgi:DnaA family protein
VNLSTSLSAQLSLGLELNYTKTLENFYPGSNLELVRAIEALLEGETENFIYIFGPEGLGKSHLLQAACHEAKRLCVSSIYFSLAEVCQHPEAALENLEELSLVCLDDLDAIVGNRAWEEKLFHLFNAMRSRGSHLVVAAKRPARELNFALEDLKSRLGWGLTFKIHSPTDKDIAGAFLARAQMHGLIVPSDVIEFLMNRLPRSIQGMMNIFDQLNKASMVEQRKLTVPFVKQVLGL